ncbi:hypothetical protein Taro_026936 [Colocasia esculenta]|uniref:Uncharacterized protein n=1 Tax=Colocasia esculenta TaxID=4460 RepID=A0A843VD79_COLES|nr:hypothetical protein [Colocasia esculenta]
MLISSTEKNTAGSPASVKAGGWMARGRAGGNMDRIKAWTKDAAGGDGIAGLLGGLHGPSARPGVEGTVGVGSTAGRWHLAVALGAPLAAGEEEGPNGGKALDEVAASARLGGITLEWVGGLENLVAGGDGLAGGDGDVGEVEEVGGVVGGDFEEGILYVLLPKSRERGEYQKRKQ